MFAWFATFNVVDNLAETKQKKTERTPGRVERHVQCEASREKKIEFKILHASFFCLRHETDLLTAYTIWPLAPLALLEYRVRSYRSHKGVQFNFSKCEKRNKNAIASRCQ